MLCLYRPYSFRRSADGGSGGATPGDPLNGIKGMNEDSILFGVSERLARGGCLYVPTESDMVR